jgi:hypothetical protein
MHAMSWSELGAIDRLGDNSKQSKKKKLNTIERKYIIKNSGREDKVVAKQQNKWEQIN